MSSLVLVHCPTGSWTLRDTFNCWKPGVEIRGRKEFRVCITNSSREIIVPWAEKIKDWRDHRRSEHGKTVRGSHSLNGYTILQCRIRKELGCRAFKWSKSLLTRDVCKQGAPLYESVMFNCKHVVKFTLLAWRSSYVKSPCILYLSHQHDLTMCPTCTS